MPKQTILNSDFGIVFFAIIGVFLVTTFYPMNRKRPYARVIASCGLTQLPLWWLYEQMMPAYMNIRVDLFIIIPIVVTGLNLIAVRISWIVDFRRK